MKLKFAYSLYPKKVISDALKEYEDFAEFKVVDGAKATVITIKNADPEHKDILPGEFANFVLAATMDHKLAEEGI